LTFQFSFAQDYKIDPRTQLEKENPMGIYNPEETSILDLLEAVETIGIKINKFNFGKFDKNYDLMLLSDKYENGKLVETDTLAQFESSYHYYISDNPNYDFLDKLKIITKDNDFKSDLFIKTYGFTSKTQVELKRTNKNSFFSWRSYINTDWALNKKIPLMVFASSWKDKKFGFDRFCGVARLTENGEATNELLALSPSYVIIYYRVSEK